MKLFSLAVLVAVASAAHISNLSADKVSAAQMQK